MSEQKNTGIRLLIVDDQILFLESLKLVIESIAQDITIVATATNGEEAVNRLKEHPVDAILMDVRMPVMDGVTAAKIIHETWPAIAIIMLTTFDDDGYVREAMNNGASGYLLKNIAPKMLVSAVRAVCDGSILMDPNIAGTLMQHLYSNKSNAERITGEKLPEWFFDLSPKERTIIKHMLQGKSNKEIAADANIGEQTVRNYISAIYAKLGTSDRRTLLAKAREIPPAYFS
ncbi:response regulator transcription factor [Treponema brennaborense]|uniref:Two component transcriptional regulator, LuxR family n=1 Tax=Treponema brennaborense (strain DSM 12168 / CIP 105900 / DD5/3) TaxID=906968 RepID=F4LQ20_TREBD|nr:response regulator transcription factor [Treponema brennaborense]AEE17098.1 two component transcriptional regulator, LuxR family [Treponema brennaborense DSM 12168]